MRPSNEKGVIAVLDTLPECKLVAEALDDLSIPREPSDFSANDFGYRFYTQTKYEPRPPHASAFVELVWKDNPEFKIGEQDVEFVVRAANRILNQKRISDRFYNHISGRAKAAQSVIKFFNY